METQLQQNNPGVSEESMAVGCLPSADVMESAPPCLEAQYSLRPLIFMPPQASRLTSGETSSRNDAAMLGNSPRFISKTLIQGASQPTAGYGGSAGENERSGHFQYEDIAGIMGERVGSVSDMSGVSEKICSGYSSSGEHYGGRIKFMCSFGGKILPRPGDGKLRYAGGNTRIISIYRHLKYTDLMCKMQQLYGQPVLLKYQLPNEDLDALISVSCDEDVDNMLEEYDRLQSSDGSSKLRIFLFPPSEYDVGLVTDVSDTRSTEKVYVDAVNGMSETQAIRPVGMVPTYSSNSVMGLEPSDTWGSQQLPTGISHVAPIVPPSTFVIAPAIGQPLPVGMLQSTNMQHFPRHFSSSPPNPSSPTLASNIRQPAIPDTLHTLYPDQFVKGRPAHLHGIQRSDASYQDVESHMRSGTPSLSSQCDAPVWHLQSRKHTDSPTSAHHETKADHFFHPEQSVISDPLVATGIPIGVVSHLDSHGRVPTMDSLNNLMLPQVQRRETGVRPLNIDQVCETEVSPLSLELQNLALQEQVPLFQEPRQHALEPRREKFQKADHVQFCPLENVQGIAIPSQQQISPQYYSPVVTSGNQIVGFGQPEFLPEWLPQKNLIVETATYPSGSGLLQPGSVPPSPCLGIQDSNLELNVIQQCIPHEGGQNRGHSEHPLAKIAVHPENDLPMRGLKPLNTRVDNKERFFCGDEQTMRNQFPMAIAKADKPQDNHEGTYLQDYFAEGLTQPRTPPYAGGSPYRESLSPFVDRKVIRGDGVHGQMKSEDTAVVYPHLSPFADRKVVRDDGNVQPHCENGVPTHTQYHDAVDWAMNKQQNEATHVGWNNFNQLERMEEPNTDINLIKLGDNSPLHTCDSSFVNPSTISIGQINTEAALKTSTMLTNIAENLATLKGVESLAMAQSPRLNGTPLSNALSSNPTGSSNSLFVAKLEEGQWFKGIEADTQMKNDPGENFIEEAFGIPDNTFLPDSLSGHLNDDNDPQQNSLCDPQRQVTTSISTYSPIEMGDLQASWLPSHLSGGTGETGGPVHCFTEEEITSSKYLTKGLGYFNEDFMSSAQNKEWCSGIRSSGDRVPNLIDNASVISNVTEGKRELPTLDSNPVQTSLVEGDLAHMPNNIEAVVTSSLLYSEPTLSIQNWKESLAAAKLEEQEPTESFLDNEKKDEVTLCGIVRKVSVMKVDEDSGDTNGDKSSTHQHPAAVAEAEAISRGLQTIKNADLEELRELGTGNFGTVYHGKWRGTDVAIKRIKSSCFTGRPSERERLIADFWNEAYVLGQLHHPNVVAFYGVVPDGPDGTLATVTEYMVNGSLKQVLQKKDRTIDRRKRLLIIMDAAFGMEYLHGKNIIHFDFKCENLLVNMKDPQRPICKVGDLGLSKVKRQTMVSGGVRGTLPWMAPELLNGSSSFVTDKVDVFSFGVVMWELLTGEEPYADMHYGAIIGGIVNNTLRPTIPSWCEPAWKSLMERCWSTDPSERPSFVEIAAELRAMANSKS